MSLFSIDPDIARAKTLHTSFYTNLAIFESAKEKIFSLPGNSSGIQALFRNPVPVSP